MKGEGERWSVTGPAEPDRAEEAAATAVSAVAEHRVARSFGSLSGSIRALRRARR